MLSEEKCCPKKRFCFQYKSQQSVLSLLQNQLCTILSFSHVQCCIVLISRCAFQGSCLLTVRSSNASFLFLRSSCRDSWWWGAVCGHRESLMECNKVIIASEKFWSRMLRASSIFCEKVKSNVITASEQLGSIWSRECVRPFSKSSAAVRVSSTSMTCNSAATCHRPVACFFAILFIAEMLRFCSTFYCWLFFVQVQCPVRMDLVSLCILHLVLFKQRACSFHCKRNFSAFVQSASRNASAKRWFIPL